MMKGPSKSWPLTSGGLHRPDTAHVDGAVLHRAREDKETKYVELLQVKRCHLVVVGVDTGGRWSSEAATFADHLASGRVREVPSVLRKSEHLAKRQRWMRMLAVSCGLAFAASLVSERCDTWRGTDGPKPNLADLFGEVWA